MATEGNRPHMPPAATFVVPGGLDRVTGGNIYDRAMIDALRRHGWSVEVRDPRAIGSEAGILIVDSLAFPFGRPQLDVTYAVLVHQIPSAVDGFPEPTVAERDVFRFAALVVVVSDWLRDVASAFTEAPVVVIPPGRDRAWSPDGPAPDADSALVVSNATPGKGVPEAIDAFARAGVKGLRLVLVGEFAVDPEEEKRVRRALDRCDGPVEPAGVLEPDELAGRYAGARVLLTASRYEGRPLAVTEAMASGVPVAGYDVPGVRELVRHGRDGLLARVGEVGDLATSLHDLATEPELASAMGRTARRRAMQWPTWAESADRFADALKQLS